MKRWLIAALALICMFAAIFCANIALGKTTSRVHQHMRAEEKEMCSCADTTCTHLPIIIIDTLGNTIPYHENLKVDYDYDELYTAASISVIDNENSYNHVGDSPELISLADVKYRGNMSYSFDKKQYLIKLKTETGENNSVSVMGMPKECEWVLNGPYFDKSLMRNYMIYNISGEIMDWAPNVRFCEAYVGSGGEYEYQGLYVMIESVKRDENRVNISQTLEGSEQTPYIVERDRASEDKKHIEPFATYAGLTGGYLYVQYPGKEIISPEYERYIQRDLAYFEKTIYSLDYDDPFIGYEKYIDVDSFVDYYVINEFFMNYDAGHYSTYAYRDILGKIHMGPVWDFNMAMNNYELYIPMNNFIMFDEPWFEMLSRDEVFIEKVINRYRELREGVLSEEYLLNYIDDTRAYLGDAVDRNYEKWGYVFDLDLRQPATRNTRTYDEEIAELKSYITERGQWLDKNIWLLGQFCHESKVKNYN